MRIVYVGNAASIHLRRWAGFFADQGHDVHIVTTTPDEGGVDARITVHELLAPRGGPGPLLLASVALAIPIMARRLRRILESLKPDVVHVHYLNEAALWAVRARAQPLVVTAWGSDIVAATARSIVRRAAVRYVLKRVALATCDADHMRRRLIEHGAPPERAVVVFFGTNVERCHPRFRDPSFHQDSSARVPIVVSTRNLEPVYDIETLIRAVPLVLSSVPRVKFLLGGSGTLLEPLRALAGELGIGSSIEFIGRQSQEQLAVLLASSDVYVSTALSDGGLAASTAEAMASAVPVVITDVEDNADWVTSDATGLLVAASAPAEVAAAITRLLTNPERAALIGLAGRDVIVRRNNFAVEMGKVEVMYRSVAAAANR